MPSEAYAVGQGLPLSVKRDVFDLVVVYDVGFRSRIRLYMGGCRGNLFSFMPSEKTTFTKIVFPADTVSVSGFVH